MSDISLYRKYRPHNFDNLVGQDHVKNTLINAIKSDSIAHAYLFTGPRGTGKTSTARLIAKALICNNLKDDYEPCDECEFCKDISIGRLIDLIEIDAASNRGIDEVRDLKEKIKFAPSRAKYKVYIIDEVHMMTKEAFNALLKTLEEPPAHAYFILATTEIHKIPDTIISRCQRFDFKRISEKCLMTRLSYIAQKENVEADAEALEIISHYVNGGLRDAIGIFEQLTSDKKLTHEHVKEILAVTDNSLLENLLDSLAKNETSKALKIVNDVYGQGSDLKQFTNEIIELLRKKMLANISSNKIEADKFLNMIEIFQEAQQNLESSIPQLALEIAIIKISGPVEIVKKEQITEEKIEKVVVKENKNREHKNIEEQSSDLSLELIQENWPRITERIKTPSLRMSLKSAIPTKLLDHDLTLELSTKFHKDKIMESENRIELEKTIKDVLKFSLKIITEVKSLEIKPVVKETQSPPAITEPSGSHIDEALEIFGGELVEE